jgi:hypothetical protein
LLASSGPVLAFRRAEHKELGDVGFVLALENLRSRSTSARLPESDLEKLRPNAGGGGTFQSYGDIVFLTDYVKDPSEFLAVAERAGAGVATFPGVNFEGLARLKRSFGRYAAAVHDDDHHFSSMALYTFWFWHKTAVETAARDHGLLAALALNAFADHHLHDLHAPGHFLTRKAGMHDAAANALHDAYNAGGHDFEIDRAAFDADLAGLLREMRTADVTEWFRIPRPGPADFDGLAGATSLRFFGDGSLIAHQDERIFLALLTARSVLDVTESYASKEVRNSFAVREWRDYDVVREAGRRRVMTPSMKLAYGGFPSVPLDRHPGSPFSKGGHFAFLPVWAVGVGLDSIAANGEFMSAGRLDLEAVWLWHLPIPPETLARSTGPDRGFALSTGVTLRSGGDGWQAGAILRVIRPLRLIDAQVSLGITPRWMKSSNLQDAAFRTGAEARFEWGFGLVFVGAGISRDYRLGRADPAPVQGWGVTTNVSLMLTPGILKHLGKPFGLGL